MKVPLCLIVLLSVSAQALGSLPLDCADVQEAGAASSGVFRVYPAGPTSPRYVYCDMDTDGGNWTVFQRRMDGSLNFYRGWEQYKQGFGHAAGEYWLGLDLLQLLTSSRPQELRVEMEDFEGNTAYAHYSSFALSPGVEDAEADGYKLHVSGFTNGGAGDSMKSHNLRRFSTFDRDLDSTMSNCASKYKGGFWYSRCGDANLNGLYMWGQRDASSCRWYQWKRNNYSLRSVSMKVRPSAQPEPEPEEQ